MGFFIHELYNLGFDTFNELSQIGYVFINLHVDTKEPIFGTLFKLFMIRIVVKLSIAMSFLYICKLLTFKIAINMEIFTIIIGLVVITFGILQIILFFKLWGMTDNVKRLCYKVCDNEDIEKAPKIRADALTTIIVVGVVLVIIAYALLTNGF